MLGVYPPSHSERGYSKYIPHHKDTPPLKFCAGFPVLQFYIGGVFPPH